MNVGNDRIVGMFSLQFIYSYVLSSWFMKERERKKFLIYLPLRKSPTLVLVLTCLTVVPFVYPSTIAILLELPGGSQRNPGGHTCCS